MTTFEQYGFSESILKAIKDRGFEAPTEVQQKSFQPVLEGKDVVVQSKTGSGKTAAFGLPLIELLKDGDAGLRAIIMTPTRELAKQVHEDLESYAKYTNLKFAIVYGGVGMEPQINAIRKADIVVGTPGRILDHLGQGTLRLDDIQFLVLDEADRMLDMGFIDDVRQIIKHIPNDHITMMFSATMPDQIREIADKMMVEPEQVKCESFVSDALLSQYYIDTSNKHKLSILKELLNRETPELAIVFCATRGLTDAVADFLQSEKIEAHAIHGGLTQAKREHVLKGFHAGKVHVLVATDVAARGLDIDDVTHVFNYNVPKTPQEYVHRMGRTARAGREGKVVTLLSHDEHDDFGRIDSHFQGKIAAYDLGEFKPFVVNMPRRAPSFGHRHTEHRGGPRQGGRSFGRSGGGPRGERSSERPRSERPQGERSDAPRRQFGRREGERPQRSERSFYGAKN
jgi:ATP-dependent RNA helicase DeaD